MNTRQKRMLLTLAGYGPEQVFGDWYNADIENVDGRTGAALVRRGFADRVYRRAHRSDTYPEFRINAEGVRALWQVHPDIMRDLGYPAPTDA